MYREGFAGNVLRFFSFTYIFLLITRKEELFVYCKPFYRNLSFKSISGFCTIQLILIVRLLLL